MSSTYISNLQQDVVDFASTEPCESLQITSLDLFVIQKITTLNDLCMVLIGYFMPTVSLAAGARFIEFQSNQHSLQNSTDYVVPQPLEMESLSEEITSEVLLIMLRYKTKQAIVKVNRLAFDLEHLQRISSTSLIETNINTTFHYYESNSLPKELNSTKIEIIYPCDQRSLWKYSDTKQVLIKETPEKYDEIHKPIIDGFLSNPNHLGWVYNLLEHKEEVEFALLEDTDPVLGFIMFMSPNWTTVLRSNLQTLAREFHESPVRDDAFIIASDKTPSFPRDLVESFWGLTIVHTKDIACLRDLNAEHLGLLRNLRDKTYEHLKRAYGIPCQDVVLYFHYPPTFYHLHLHVQHVASKDIFAGRCILLEDVIANIEMKGDFYQQATIMCKVSDSLAITRAYAKAENW